MHVPQPTDSARTVVTAHTGQGLGPELGVKIKNSVLLSEACHVEIWCIEKSVHHDHALHTLLHFTFT